MRRALGVVPDPALLDELVEDGADGLVPGCGTVSNLVLGECGIGLGEGLEDAPFGDLGLRVFAGRGQGPLLERGASLQAAMRGVVVLALNSRPQSAVEGS